MKFKVNLNQLYIFYTITKFRSFKDAAAHLFLSQPAVSIQVKNLEQGMGFSLFKKKATPLELTQKADALLPIIEEIFGNVDILNKKVEAFQREEKNQVVIAMHSIPAEAMFPMLYNFFKVHLPNVLIEFRVCTHKEALEKVKNKEVHLFIRANTFDDFDGIQTQEFFEFEIPLVVSPNNPLVQKGKLSLKELQSINLLVHDEKQGFSKHVRDFLVKNKINLHVPNYLYNTNFDKNFVKNSYYGAFLNSSLISEELNDGKLIKIDLEKEMPACRYYIAYLEESMKNKNVNRVMNVLKTVKSVDDLTKINIFDKLAASPY